ncbi:MAG: diacylglycerol kinase family protein [Bacteroidetes bacterium]|nr:diacylglycerol kinase family protein [Bacteroidota bacterium]
MENHKDKNYLQQRSKAFKHAWDGLKSFPKEAHAKIHIVAALVVIVLAFVLKVNSSEFMLLLLCIALVFMAEMLNAAFERLCDVLHPEQHPLIKEGKDLAAGAVLICSVIAAAIGLFIFGQKLLYLLEQ